jgi:SWI/SNF-related matrix-associated actin-dependent regulator of chromatin subfamily A3
MPVQGLGKTVQTLGLILSHPPRGQRGYPYKRLSLNSVTPPRCTLIVCPVSVMSNWQIQIKKHVNGGGKNNVLAVGLYYGTKRESIVSWVQHNQIDILITSYNTLAYDLKKLDLESDENLSKLPQFMKKNEKKRKATGTLLSIYDVPFHRVIHDEAHMIRSSTSGFFKAAARLQTQYRLCLTGTPFVNRVQVDSL